MRSRASEGKPQSSSWFGMAFAIFVGFSLLVLLWLLSDDLRSATMELIGSQGNPSSVQVVEKASSPPAALLPPHPIVDAIVKNEVKSSSNKTLIVKVKDEASQKIIEIYDEPIPSECYPTKNADYDGDAVRWGLGNKASSAAECCRQCKEHKGERPCNIWVWCGDPSGECWTMDIHEHRTGDCWLKHQAGLKGDLSNLKINHKGAFTQEFKREHKTAPELIPWTAGVIVRNP